VLFRRNIAQTPGEERQPRHRPLPVQRTQQPRHRPLPLQRTQQPRHRSQRISSPSAAIALILSALCLLHGCSFTDNPVETPTITNEQQHDAPATHDDPVRTVPDPGQFTLRYVPDSPLNPITGLNRDNIVLASLLYEGLFRLDSNLGVSAVLCDNWETEDNITFKFIIKPDIAMSDGSLLTAEDVVYSITQASQKGRFANRLSVIKSITVDEEEFLTFYIVLRSANRNFIKLLDIPIIKSGSIDHQIPPGTGPYIFAGGNVMQLAPFIRHRSYNSLPVPMIKLIECKDNELAEMFDSGILSLLVDDPADTLDIILNRQNELRAFETTTLQYIGFNTRSAILKDVDVRRAIGSSIDRAYIVGSIMPGQPFAAPLALSPAYRFYDKSWEQLASDPLIEMSALLIHAGLKDYDNDSFLEYPDESGGYYKISLDFIVNSENKYKVRAAHKIADTLRMYGIEIIVRELPWENFTAALASSSFDLYYGEVSLGADFDMSPLLLPNSSLNYGKTGNIYFEPLIEAFLSAETDEEERAAAETLCDEINIYSPFVPLLYKRHAMFTPIGAITGATPSQSGVFGAIDSWTIDLTMLT